MKRDLIYRDIIKDKNKNYKIMLFETMNKVQGMFKISNLPDTIPEEEFKKILFEDGFAIIDAGFDGQPYAYAASIGGKCDAYYRPIEAIIANPWQNYNATREIGKDCVIVRCDPYMIGIRRIVEKWVSALVETDVSIRIAKINGRLQSLMSAFDSKTYQSAVDFLQGIEDGKLGVIRQNFNSQITDTMSIQAQPLANASSSIIKELIELRTYEESCLLERISLKKNGNVKRENISENEASLDDDPIKINADVIKESIQKGIDEMNEMFGLSVEIEFDSSWLDNILEEEQAIESLTEEDDVEDAETEEEMTSEENESQDEEKEEEKEEDEEEEEKKEDD